MPDPIVMTDRRGRARLPHGLDGPPTLVVLRVGSGATDMLAELAKFVVEDFDAESVGFRVLRADTGQPLAGQALPVRMSAR